MIIIFNSSYLPKSGKDFLNLTFDEVVDLLPPSAGGGVELEGPQEV